MDTRSPESEEGSISVRVNPSPGRPTRSILERMAVSGIANVKISCTDDTRIGNKSVRTSTTFDVTIFEPCEIMFSTKS